jgi:arabinofuranan 3-O-arabinosyltransferase
VRGRRAAAHIIGSSTTLSTDTVTPLSRGPIRVWERCTDGWRRYVVLAVVIYLPLLIARPGDVAADTKSYLYVDPSGLLERARSVWEPSVGGGTITHQTIGYLWPMGPYYWLMDAIGVPDWLAQRFWIASLLFAAGAGTLRLLDQVLPPRRWNLVGALLYGVTPFILGHATGQSALLMPYAALPWLVMFMGRATREGGWRWPAAYALVVTTCGSLNGSSVFFVILGSALWAPMLVRSEPDIGYRSALGALVRTGVLTLATQLWWMVTYAVSGSYALPILDMTEQLLATSGTTSSLEIIRGLGYWFFYGNDVTGSWLSNISPIHQDRLVVLAASFVLPMAALLAGSALRWSHRAYFALLAVVGFVLSVGSFTASGRSPYGELFYRAADASPLVFSLRNHQRAGPLMVLGFAVLVTAALHALVVRGRQVAGAAAVVLLVAGAVAFPTFWTSGLVADRFQRTEDLPDYWLEAAEYLDQGEGRILEMPGIDFASYRWGNTLDPISSDLIERPLIWRELIPLGTEPGLNLLGALDRSIQEGWFEPEALPVVADLLGVTDVLVRSDLRYEHYRTVRPRVLWDAFTPTPEGLEDPTTFGDDVVNRAPPSLPMIDEVELGIPDDVEEPPALAVFHVAREDRFVRAEPSNGGVILSGAADGVVSAAAAGLLDDNDGPLFYAAEVTLTPEALDRALSPTTDLILTDSNRKRAQHWYSLRENMGATEPLGGRAMPTDVSDARLPAIPDQLDRSLTTVEYRGAARVWASSYGSDATLTPENRAVMAFDGDIRTAWMAVPRAEEETLIGIELDSPSDADQIILRQPFDRPGRQRIQNIQIRLDDRVLDVDMKDSSLTVQGQVVPLDGEPFSSLTIEIGDVTGGYAPAGFSSIDIPGVVLEEIVHLPTDLTETVGPAMLDHPVSIVLTRERANPAEVVRYDPELSMSRAVHLPGAATAELTGTARLSAHAPDTTIDRLVGIPPVEDGGITVTSRERIGGDLRSRASAAFDGDSDTEWRSPFGLQTGTWLELVSAESFTIDSLDIELVADGLHSVPELIDVQVDGGETIRLDVPEITDGDEPDATTHLDLPLGTTLTGNTFRVSFPELDLRWTTDWYSGQELEMPIAVAEVDLGDVVVPAPAAELDGECRQLVDVDGQPISVRIEGSVEDALDRLGLDVTACDQQVQLAAEESLLRTEAGADTGFDIDRVVLETGADPVSPGPVPDELPTIEWDRPSRSAIDVVATPTNDEPFWLVVSESWNQAWTATADGVDLGPPTVHDGFGMGWWIEPDGDEPITVEIRWAPQGWVDPALAVSVATALVCGIVLFIRRRRPNPTLRGTSPGLLTEPFRPTRATLLGCLVAGALFVTPLAGVALAAVIGITMVVPRTRPILRLLPSLLVGVGALYLLALQIRWGYSAGTFWPRHFVRVHRIVMVAPILMAVLAWTESRRPESESEPTGS